ncbi:MAG TPA: nitrile hydratase accessory protein [Nocardioides sp.]|nr:nitrile hydratase accessory protein [Nocardioides sp.]HRK44092.1 nitrile hydratase accessory protein [Nocardioides sp.]
MGGERLEERRREIEELLCGLPGERDGERSFDEPWQIRAFALAVGAHRAGQYEWAEFQSALIDSIKGWEDDATSASTWSYYEHWVTALESVLGEHGAIETVSLDAKTREVLATPPNRDHHTAHLDPIAVDPAIRH